MSNLDANHAAALDLPVIRPIRFAFIDFDGAPLRLTDCPYGVSFTTSGDEDLDGFTFVPADTTLISVSDVQHNVNGADTVTFTFSAMIDEDSDFMNEIGDVTKWQGRVVRLWRAQIDDNFAMYGRPDPYFTGYMSVPKFHFGKDVATVQMSAETYLASYSQAANRTYLSQSEYDAGDHSAELSIAIANGTNAVQGSLVDKLAQAGGLIGVGARWAGGV